MLTTPKQSVIGIIPARYASSRFPGKPLAQIAGKTMIQRTYESAQSCACLNSLVVATDDQRIFDHVVDFGGKAVMTSSECPTGTDRLIEVLKNGSFSPKAIIVNIQGDTPCIEPQVIDRVVSILMLDSQAVMSTAAMRIQSQEEALSPHVVKCVLDQQLNALYFSRGLIPCGLNSSFKADIPYYHHIGIYAYRCDFLLNHYAQLPMTPLQKAEDLEQLKVLEHGFRIKVALVDSNSIGVDTHQDIKKVEQLICKQNISSSQAGFAHL